MWFAVATFHLLNLSLHKLPEHFLGIYRNEDSFAAGQHFAFSIHDLSHVDVLAAMDAHFPALHPQGLMQRHGLQIFNRHLFRKSHHVPQLVHFAHRVIQNAGDDASVTVAGRARITVAELEVTYERAPLFIERKGQTHPLRIVRTADETVIPWKLKTLSFVPVDLTRHARIVADGYRTTVSGTDHALCEPASNPVYICVSKMLPPK